MARKPDRPKGKGRKPKHQPEPRGRRGHGAVKTQPGLSAWLVENYCKADPRPTLDEIYEKAKGTGYSIGRTAIWKFDLQFQIAHAEKDFLLDLAKQYNETAADGEVLDIETAIATFGAAKIYQDLLSRTGEQLSERDLELLDAFRKLQSSSSMRERTKFGVDRGKRAMAKRYRAEVQAILRKDPETLRKVLTAIETAEREDG